LAMLALNASATLLMNRIKADKFLVGIEVFQAMKGLIHRLVATDVQKVWCYCQ